MSFSVGSLVKARGREWVVLPESSARVLFVKPLGATDAETTTILTSVEKVEPATFAPPSPENLGDLSAARLLREAVRLGFRAGAGPFRCVASLGFEPRPYQLVPLLMALRLDPVRLLIADDVGIGKTIEAGLIAKELLARGEVSRLSVLCPPHLAEQWQVELEQKFGIEAELVLPSTISRLERRCAPGESVFDRFPATIVSLDYIKSERRRDDFARACPELVIVDEAHTCTEAQSGARQQRFRLVKQLSENPARHLLLVTATPHSGKEDAFRSLLSLLKPEFASLPDDLSGDRHRSERETLARYFVQRRRADLKRFLHVDTPFPERCEEEETYRLHPEYRRFMERVLEYAREIVADESGTKYQQRIRWWSALALLRSISSSPAAAAATLRARARSAAALTVEEADELGRQEVLDLVGEEVGESPDTAPGADFTEDDQRTRKRLLELAREAEKLEGDKDHKLQRLIEVVQGLVRDGFSPVVFCRFIETAEYVARALRERLAGVDVACATGRLPHEEREERVLEVARAERRVLVCTDCLSEGINLQEWFDAAVHADLAWSPTRHEQREGRVDRFNQRSTQVRIVTFYGEDNPIDGLVLRVLLRKHKAIRCSLGVSVPVPADWEKVAEAIFEALLLTGRPVLNDQYLLFDELLAPKTQRFLAEWERAADQEKSSRAIFAQRAIKPEEVLPVLEETRRAIGAPADLERFVREALHAYGVKIQKSDPFRLDLSSCPFALRDAVRYEKPFFASFCVPAPKGAVALTRTHPFVESLAGYVLDAALSGEPDAAARRCGVVASDVVQKRTTVLILRFRFRLAGRKGEMLAEECAVAAFSGLPTNPQWLPQEEAEALLEQPAAGNVAPDMARSLLEGTISRLDALAEPLHRIARTRAEALLAAHRRVREALRGADAAHSVEVQGQPDVIGLYVLVPTGGGA